MAAVEDEPGWPGLPWDLLDAVLRRLPTLTDRIRLGAVCRPWHSATKLLPAPPPHLPWIILHDGTLFDLSNKEPAYQVSLPDDAYCYSAGENMIFLLHHDGRCSLLNTLSGDTTHLPELAALLQKYAAVADPWERPLNQRLRKVVMSASLSIPGPIVALLVYNGHGVAEVVVSTCRPAGETNSCLICPIMGRIDDIAFSQGKLYALYRHCRNERLIAFELGALEYKPTPPCVRPNWELPLFSEKSGVKPKYMCGTTVVDMETVKDNRGLHYDQVKRYLVESNGKLLMVTDWKKYIYIPVTRRRHKRQKIQHFEVWEADMSNHGWKEVHGGLDGRAIFVSFPCSKSVPAAADSLHGAQEDCIYTLRSMEFIPKLIPTRLEDPLSDSGVYNMRTKTFLSFVPELMQPMPSETESGRFPAWFFPIKV